MTPDEKSALEGVRLAHSFVCDAATGCQSAGLDGQEVRDCLREASMQLLRLVAVIEGRPFDAKSTP